MSFTISTRTSVSVAKTYAAAKAVTAASNAASCVLTLDNSTSAIAANDYVEVTSTWSLLDKRVVRVSAANATTITLEGVNTTDTGKYPTGSGAGTGAQVRKITVWSQMSQIKGLSSSGGELQFADITTLDDQVAKQMPTIRSAMSMNVEVFDDPSLAWYADVQAASDARTPYAMLMAFPNGSKTLANAYWNLNPIATVATNEALTNTIGLSYAAEPIRYTS